MSNEITIETNLTADKLRAMARKEPKRRAAMRMLAIANELDGFDWDDAARSAGMSDQALRDAIKRFNAEGVAGLQDRPRPGRPCRLDAEQDAAIKAAVLTGPNIEKDGLSSFTLEDIRKLIAERFEVDYHIGYMGSVMQRLGLSRQKARPSHPKKDPAAETAFKKRSTQIAPSCSGNS